VAGLYARTITRINPDSGQPLWTRQIGGSPIGVAAGEGAVWVSNESGSTITRIDPRSGRVIQPIGVGNAPGAIAVGAGAVWVANTLDGTVSRIDPATNAVVWTVGVGEAPAALAVDDEGVWVASELAGTIVRIDPRTNTVVDRIETGQRPVGVALDGRRLWVAARDAAPAHRGGTLRVGDDSDLAAADQVNLTGDGLTAYRRVGGTEGARVVPDLAVSMPTVSEGGTTYTFQLRGGIRYSTGETVGPADFRRAIERFYRLGPADVADYDTIVGAAACRRRPATCDLSRGIVADTPANTVTFHLTRPNPNLIYSLALPFAHAAAPSAPRIEVTDRGLPATGPYMVASRRPGELRFVRNPWFREWSRAARPDGYPDEIVATVAPDEAPTVSAIEQGRLDTVLWVQLPPALLERLAVRYASRLHVDPLVNSRVLVALNTTRPPFDRIDARRAVAYALDRQELVRIGGGPQYAEVACQILPPNFPAYRTYCPYTPDPGPDGAWRGPDLLEAKRLVARSGTAGATVVVRTPPPFIAEARYVADLLRRLGYRASARVSSPDEWQADAYRAQEGAAPVQVGLVAWFIGYPAPSQFFEQLRCGASDPARFCSPAIDRLMDQALALQTTDPAAADKLWERVDRALTDQAAWIPYATPRQHRFVSKRVGNYQSHPVWGTLLDQLWVR
jgi:YVTN family beta-propeller protein